jgi:hypothetical protein
MRTKRLSCTALAATLAAMSAIGEELKARGLSHVSVSYNTSFHGFDVEARGNLAYIDLKDSGR